MLPAHDVHGFEFAALDSLQDGLARHPERPDSLAHRQKVLGRFAVEARLEFIGQTNAPGRAWRELLAGDNAVIEQTMDRRGSDTERGGGLLDGQKIAGGLRFVLEARDLPVGVNCRRGCGRSGGRKRSCGPAG